MNPPEESRSGYSRSEWVSLGVSLAILGLLVGIVIILWLNPVERPAKFDVRADRTRMEGGSYYVEFTIENKGDQTGEYVRVEGFIPVGGRREKASTTFDFVPGRSEEHGVLIFEHEPVGLAIRVVSYQIP